MQLSTWEDKPGPDGYGVDCSDSFPSPFERKLLAEAAESEQDED